MTQPPVDPGALPFDRDFWERHWQPRPDPMPGEQQPVQREGRPGPPVNPHLVAGTSELAPGTALDAGAGAGAEAMWLAAAGWQVSAVDISGTALARARELAARVADAEVNGRVTWIEADLERWDPGRTFDLVTTHYAHPTMPQLDFYARLGEWVAAGGTLLIVGHGRAHEHGEPDNNEGSAGHGEPAGHGHGQGGPPAHATITAAGVVARFDGDEWEVLAAGEARRTVTGPGGHPVDLHDVVVRLRRRGRP